MVASNSKQEGIKVTCKCGKEWFYKGNNKVYATCPDCRTPIKIKDLIEKTEV